LRKRGWYREQPETNELFEESGHIRELMLARDTGQREEK